MKKLIAVSIFLIALTGSAQAGDLDVRLGLVLDTGFLAVQLNDVGHRHLAYHDYYRHYRKHHRHDRYCRHDGYRHGYRHGYGHGKRHHHDRHAWDNGHRDRRHDRDDRHRGERTQYDRALPPRSGYDHGAYGKVIKRIDSRF